MNSGRMFIVVPIEVGKIVTDRFLHYRAGFICGAGNSIFRRVCDLVNSEPVARYHDGTSWEPPKRLLCNTTALATLARARGLLLGPKSNTFARAGSQSSFGNLASSLDTPPTSSER